MNNPIKVLVLEDMKSHQELLKREVLKIYPKAVFTIADDRNSFFEKISWLTPDIVLADYKLPDFNGLEALLFIKEKMPDVPFVFVTGSLNNEEYAAGAILKGASGYVLKDNLSKISEVIQSVLSANQERLAAREEKARLFRENMLAIEKAHAKLTQASATDALDDVASTLKKIKEDLHKIIA